MQPRRTNEPNSVGSPGSPPLAAGHRQSWLTRRHEEHRAERRRKTVFFLRGFVALCENQHARAIRRTNEPNSATRAGSPVPRSANWVRFARTACGRVRTAKCEVRTSGLSCLTLETANLRLLQKLASFYTTTSSASDPVRPAGGSMPARNRLRAGPSRSCHWRREDCRAPLAMT